MSTHWGKAGQRLTHTQARERKGNRSRTRAAYTQAVVAQTNQARYNAAHTRWEQGLVVPCAITTFLDMRSLDGPGVDEACGVKEPTVDLWEAGRVYPTWEQLLALADLCQVPVWRFTEPPLHHTDGPIFICGPRTTSHTPEGPPITVFDPLALAAAGINPYPTNPPTDPDGQHRLI